MAEAAAAAKAAAEAKAQADSKARAEAEERAKQEAVARVLHETELRTRAEEEVKARVAAELKAREKAEMEADARYRAEIEQRARAAAAERQKRMEAEPAEAAKPATARKRMKWVTVTGLGALVLVAAVVALLHFVPLTGYIPAVERLVAQRLGQPVSIASMRYALLPSPELTLEQVAIGKGGDIKVDTMVVHAGPFALLSGQKDIDSVDANSVTADQDALAAAAGWIRAQSGAQPLVVRKLRLNRVRLGLRGFDVPIFDADFALARDGTLQKALLTDGKMRIGLAPKDKAWQVNLDARGWTAPIGPRLEFDDLAATAVIDREQAVVTRIEGRVARSAVKGVAKLNWGGDIRAAGEFSITNGDLGRLLAAFTRDFAANGTLNANVSYAVRGSTLATLFANPRIEANFNIEKGTLSNVDIVRAIQSPLRDGVRGGNTKFDVLAGSLQIAGNRYSYRQLRLNSGPMNANGSFDIAPEGELSGRITAEVGTKSVIVARGALTVAGSVKAPLLKP